MFSFATFLSLLFLVLTGLCSLTQAEETITTYQDPSLHSSLTTPFTAPSSKKTSLPLQRVRVTRRTTTAAETGDSVNYSSAEPTISPTYEPTMPTCICTFEPTSEPTFQPTFEPTFMPTFEPTHEPTPEPTGAPVVKEVDIHTGGIFSTEGARDAGIVALIIVSIALFLSILALLSQIYYIMYMRVKTKEEVPEPVVPEGGDVEAPLHT